MMYIIQGSASALDLNPRGMPLSLGQLGQLVLEKPDPYGSISIFLYNHSGEGSPLYYKGPLLPPTIRQGPHRKKAWRKET